MKLTCGYYRFGNCWRWIPQFNLYWAGKIWHFGLWRFYLELDFRRGGLAEQLLTKKEYAELKERLKNAGY